MKYYNTVIVLLVRPPKPHISSYPSAESPYYRYGSSKGKAGHYSFTIVEYSYFDESGVESLVIENDDKYAKHVHAKDQVR